MRKFMLPSKSLVARAIDNSPPGTFGQADACDCLCVPKGQ
jgi:hypothetical protein